MEPTPTQPQSSATSTTEVNFNVRYLATPSGILRIVELLFGLLCWALTAEISPWSPPHQYVMFASVTPWIISL